MESNTENLKIKTSVITNPVTFYNNAGLDKPVQKEIKSLLEDRELSFGVHPDMEAKQKEYKEILDRIGDPENYDLQLPFFQRFQVVDPAEQSSKWELTSSRTIIQSESVDNDTTENHKNLGTLLIAKNPTVNGTERVRLLFRAGTSGESGLVFNFNSENDYWVASYSHNSKGTEEWNNLVIRRVLYGYSTEYGRGIRITNQTLKTLEITVVNDGDNDVLVRLYSVSDGADQARSELDVIRVRNFQIEKQGRVGLYDQSNRDSEYFNLDSWVGDENETFLPFVSELNKLTTEAYPHTFSVYNIDLRPNSWLATFKRLWAEKYFIKTKLDQNNQNFRKLFEEGESTALISPEEIDNAEGRLKQSFNEYLKAEERFEEFEAFMSGAGVQIPNLDENDDFTTIFNLNSTDSNKQIVQKLDVKLYNTWVEFYVLCSDISDSDKIREFQVEHYKFVLLNSGDIFIHEGQKYNVKNKYWRTKYRSEELEPNANHPTEIQLSNAQNASLTIQEIVSPKNNGTVNIEKDIREYSRINGEYIDQYGITLQEHVIRLTESPLKTITHVLVIPIYGLNNSKPDRMLVIKDPVFSGKQLHPFAVEFQEKYTMDIRWNGIGLGEFSHSVNLFPGEERELKIVTSKKRSWETVSKSKSSSQATSASEATQASKRNDSFASKLSDSFENSSMLSRNKKSNSSFKASVKASGGFGWFKADATADYERSSSSESNSKLSSVAKKASELASKSSAEVSENNKVSFSNSSSSEVSQESKVAGEDMESETSVIRLSNINEGKTINYNFFQVANVYNTGIRIENVIIEIDTGIEIIPGTGITISKTFEIEDFTDIRSAFSIYSEEERDKIFKLISAQILLRYTKFPKERRDDDPEILKISGPIDANKKALAIRKKCEEVIQTFARENPHNDGKNSLSEQLPNELLDLLTMQFYVEGFETKIEDQFTINTGKYYVDAHLGMMEATEAYLETRRAIETDRQKAIVAELEERTKQGIFFQEFPEGVTNLSINQQEEK
ncbi:MAG: hypothetical protein NXI10_07800 [bacterium]|nr:hypothetical protein [bacterium]